MLECLRKKNLRVIIVDEKRDRETMSKWYENVTDKQAIDLRAAEFFDKRPERKYVRVSYQYRGKTYGPYLITREQVSHLIEEKEHSTWWRK